MSDCGITFSLRLLPAQKGLIDPLSPPEFGPTEVFTFPHALIDNETFTHRWLSRWPLRDVFRERLSLSHRNRTIHGFSRPLPFGTDSFPPYQEFSIRLRILLNSSLIQSSF